MHWVEVEAMIRMAKEPLLDRIVALERELEIANQKIKALETTTKMYDAVKKFMAKENKDGNDNG